MTVQRERERDSIRALQYTGDPCFYYPFLLIPTRIPLLSHGRMLLHNHQQNVPPACKRGTGCRFFLSFFSLKACHPTTNQPFGGPRRRVPSLDPLTDMESIRRKSLVLLKMKFFTVPTVPGCLFRSFRRATLPSHVPVQNG